MVLREPIWCYAKPGTETAYGRTEKSIYFYGYTFIVKGWTVAPYSILLRACAVFAMQCAVRRWDVERVGRYDMVLGI
eukprot:3683656-Rhodomonas_salina.2